MVYFTVLGEGLEVGLSAETTPPAAEEALPVIIWDCFGMTSPTGGDWGCVSVVGRLGVGLGVGLRVGLGAVAWRPSEVVA